MRPKRRKIILALLGIVLLTVILTNLPTDKGPIQNGKPLSEWVDNYQAALNARDSQKLQQCAIPIQTIGTNALPYFLKWMRQEPPRIRRALPKWTPVRILYWIDARTRRADDVCSAAQTLGTNAVSAIPELQAMLQDSTRPVTAWRARSVLIAIGEPAIPILKVALDDPSYFDRPGIAECIGIIACRGHTNTCVPIFQQALNDSNLSVRSTATDILRQIAPKLLTNAPAP